MSSLMQVQPGYTSRKGRENNESGDHYSEYLMISKVYDSPDLAENEATFAIGPQGIINADG